MVPIVAPNLRCVFHLRVTMELTKTYHTICAIASSPLTSERRKKKEERRKKKEERREKKEEGRKKKEERRKKKEEGRTEKKRRKGPLYYYSLPKGLGSVPLSRTLSGTVVWDRCLAFVPRCLREAWTTALSVKIKQQFPIYTTDGVWGALRSRNLFWSNTLSLLAH